MLDKSTDQGNDVIVAPFAFLFLARTILQETSTGTDDKAINVIVKNKSTIEMTSKCSKLCSETTRLHLVVPLKF